MTNVIFVAPFFLDTTLRFVAGAAALRDVRLGLVSQDPLERLPQSIRERLAAHWRVEDGLDPVQIARAVEGIAERLGPPHRLLVK